MKFLLLIASLTLYANLLSQQFGWGDSGYIQGSGGGFYTNVDGNGIDVTISGFVNDYTVNGTGCMNTGINDQQSNAIQHTYQLDFSQPVDLWFTISEMNSSSIGSCYNDQLTFSGTPIFSNASGVSISGNIVTPTSAYPTNGTVTVSYSNILSIAIIHGAGTFCNPGNILICALNFGNLSIAEQYIQTEIKVHPNPSIGIVNVEFQDDDSLEKELKVFNSLGKMVYYKSVNSSTQMDLSFLKSGFYFLSVERGDQVNFIKIQIE